MTEILLISVALLLVVANGFFVAAEFALVKVRLRRLEILRDQKRPFAGTACWLARRLDASLSACQLGITMASLALGWVGEPALARLFEPVLHSMGVASPVLLHGICFAIAFAIITGLHLVLGEQVPKIFAIRRAEVVTLWCALPLQVFYFLSYPLMISLNSTSNFLLRRLGIRSASEHETHSEDEIRAVLAQSRKRGELSHNEFTLLDAVFEFDETICRRIMVPRKKVVYLEVKDELKDWFELIRRTQHTRYPVCDGSLDNVRGFIHIKDLLGKAGDDTRDVSTYLRTPRMVPETMKISRLLREFQSVQQHVMFVVDEYGTTTGIVTLDNVIERIVGPVADEFDVKIPEIVPETPGTFVVRGGTSIETINRQLELELPSGDADTLSGLLVETVGRLLKAGDTIELPGVSANVLEMEDARAERVRLALSDWVEDEEQTPDGGADG